MAKLIALNLKLFQLLILIVPAISEMAGPKHIIGPKLFANATKMHLILPTITESDAFIYSGDFIHNLTKIAYANALDFAHCSSVCIMDDICHGFSYVDEDCILLKEPVVESGTSGFMSTYYFLKAQQMQSYVDGKTVFNF